MDARELIAALRAVEASEDVPVAGWTWKEVACSLARYGGVVHRGASEPRFQSHGGHLVVERRPIVATEFGDWLRSWGDVVVGASLCEEFGLSPGAGHLPVGVHVLEGLVDHWRAGIADRLRQLLHLSLSEHLGVPESPFPEGPVQATERTVTSGASHVEATEVAWRADIPAIPHIEATVEAYRRIFEQDYPVDQVAPRGEDRDAAPRTEPAVVVEGGLPDGSSRIEVIDAI